MATSKANPPHKKIIAGITITVAILAVIGLIALIGKGHGAFTIVGFLILMLWTNVFLGYFIWATYFYNLGYGLSGKVWTKIEKAKDDKAEGKPYNADILEDEPLFNPYKDETFGLPPGTVRGMIAFSLLFGGTALLLASFDMEGEISPDSLFRDQYEFFKTAFLMMVAFYFGTRSLKYLTGKDTTMNPYNTPKAQRMGKPLDGKQSTPLDEDEEATDSSDDPDGSQPAMPANIVVVDSSDPLGEKDLKPGTKPAIKGIDPMSKPKSGK